MHYEHNYGGTIIISIIMLVILVGGLAFGEETKKWEFAPYTDFDGSIHGGLGSHYDGFALGMNFGCEFLFVGSEKFALGPTIKTGLNYDVYNENKTVGLVVDEYLIWNAAAGGIIYVGDMFYVGTGIVYNIDTFYSDTYIHDDNGNDTSIGKANYTVDEFDYYAEIGFRVDFHAAVYAKGTTHLVETENSYSKYQLYFGVRFFF